MFGTETQYLSTAEAADALRLSDSRVRQLLIAGEMRGVKVGKFAWVIDRSEVERVRTARRGPGRPRRRKTLC